MPRKNLSSCVISWFKSCAGRTSLLELRLQAARPQRLRCAQRCVRLHACTICVHGLAAFHSQPSAEMKTWFLCKASTAKLNISLGFFFFFLKGVYCFMCWDVYFTFCFLFLLKSKISGPERELAAMGNAAVHWGHERVAARCERIKRNQREKAKRSEGVSVPACTPSYFYPRRKLLNIAVFSFTLLSSFCETSRIHLSTWFFPEPDVFCLQGRTNLAAVALEAEREQNSSKAGCLVCPGAPEGCHLFLLLRILLANLTAFFWPWLG